MTISVTIFCQHCQAKRRIELNDDFVDMPTDCGNHSEVSVPQQGGAYDPWEQPKGSGGIQYT